MTYNCNEPTTPYKDYSSDCSKEQDDSKWIIFKKKGLYILHLNINNLLPN